MRRRWSVLIIIVVGVIVTIGIIGLLFTRNKAKEHVVTIYPSKLPSVTNIVGTKDNNIYYISNNNLFKQSLQNSQTTTIDKNVSSANFLNNSQFISYLKGANTADGSTFVLDLNTNTTKTFTNTYGAYYVNNQLLLLKKSSDLSFALTDESGKQALLTDAFNAFMTLDNQYIVYSQGETGRENPPFQVFDVAQKKNIKQIDVQDFSEGPWSWGKYFGFINFNNELVIYNDQLQRSSVGFGVPANQVTKQPADTQYFITFPSLNPDNPNQKIQFQISKIDLATTHLSEVVKADLPKYLEKLFRENIEQFKVQQVYYDEANNTFYIVVNNAVYQASGVEQK